MRIVSLIASATEIVDALGAGTELVGRSHECDFPESVSELPALTCARFDTKMNSLDIDTAVKDIVRDGLSVYDIDQDLLKSLSPDVILTQDQCEVCAASLDDVETAVCDWVGQDVRLVSLHPDTLADVWRDIHTVGEAIGRTTEAEELTQRLSAQMDALSLAGESSVAPSVFILEWIKPLMGAGHWIPTLVEKAGGRNVITQEGEPSRYLHWDDIHQADPDIIVVAPCGFNQDRTEKEMSAISDSEEWQTLRAVQSGRVAIMDGNRFINRPSPGVSESAAMLNDIMVHERPVNGPAAWRWHAQ